MKDLMKMAMATMAFGAVAFGSATASAYTPSTRCETVTTKKVVDAPGKRRDRVVTTTSRDCAPRRATPARPVARVVKTSPRLVVRNGRVVYVPPRIVRTGPARRVAPARAVTTTTVTKTRAPRRPTTVTTVKRHRNGKVVKTTTTTKRHRNGKAVKTRTVKRSKKSRR